MTNFHAYEVKSEDEIRQHIEQQMEAELGIDPDRDRPDGPDPIDRITAEMASEIKDTVDAIRTALNASTPSMSSENPDDDEDTSLVSFTDGEISVVDEDGDETVVGNVESTELEFPESDDDSLSKLANSLAGGDVIGLDSELSPDMVSDLNSLIPDSPSQSKVTLLDEETGTPSAGPFPSWDYTGYHFDVDHDSANTLVKGIYQRIHARHDEGHEVETLILGMPQYEVLEPWAQAEHHTSLEDVLPIENVYVVPGPMIHAAIDPRRELFDKLSEEESADDEQ